MCHLRELYVALCSARICPCDTECIVCKSEKKLNKIYFENCIKVKKNIKKDLKSKE